MCLNTVFKQLKAWRDEQSSAKKENKSEEET